jgi:predicted GNAT superfamily acetyltransferase
VIAERLPAGRRWFRICDPDWVDPLDGSFSAVRGGRWNPPRSWRTLYLCGDLVTARLNVDRFIAEWPYEPEDLDDAHGPHLAVATLPRGQVVADAHTAAGVRAAGLPVGYPLAADGTVVPHAACQVVGASARDDGLRGVYCRSARTEHGAGRELAWFPASARSRARLVRRLTFTEWFWG